MNASSAPLKILLVEDSKADVELNLRALRDLDRPLLHQCVVDEASLRQALTDFRPDVILSDFSMPGFTGLAALTISRELTPETPFIFVSGTIGEELAIEALQRGAVDYVLKDNLRRLRPAVERALRAARATREHRRTELALRDSEERFRAIVESSHDWIWETDIDGVLRYSNGAVEAILGYQAQALVGTDALAAMTRESRTRFEAVLTELIAEHKGWRDWVLSWRHRSGAIRLLESNAQPLLDEHGALIGYRGVDRDVTERTRQERKIRQLARIHEVLGALGNAVLRAHDRQDLLDAACRVAVEQGGFIAAWVAVREGSERLILSSLYGDRMAVDMVEGEYPKPLTETTATPPTVQTLIGGHRLLIADLSTALSAAPSQAALWYGVRSQIVLPLGGEPWGVLSLYGGDGLAFDSDELALLDRLASEIDHGIDFIAKSERLEYLAYHNPTTGLPSRTAFRELMPARLARAPQAVAMVDVERFRYYNDSRGRAFGDQLLRETATRLQSLLPDSALLAHPGDDAFVFAFADVNGLDDAVAQVRRLIGLCCETPFLIEGERVELQMRGSVLLAPLHGQDADAIDRNLVAVLSDSRFRDQAVVAYSEEVGERARRRVELERDLRLALADNRFELFLQPKWETSSQRLSGAEALLRWRHPQHGLVSPAEFIPVLEDTGLILEVGAWVRRRALEITRRWREQGYPELRVAVNVSARELRQATFLAECEDLLGGYAGEHELDIEVTESLLMDDIGRNVRTLQALRDLGCRVAIDDFGTGYSSLNYLSRLPTDTLKIDQSFTALLAHSPDTLALVTNVIGLAHSLGLKVVAEGVEDEEQAKLLRLLRCDELQGYFLGRPMPVADFEQQLLT